MYTVPSWHRLRLLAGFGTRELKKSVYEELALPGAPFHIGFRSRTSSPTSSGGG